MANAKYLTAGSSGNPFGLVVQESLKPSGAVWLVLHGIGERNKGDQNGLEHNYSRPYWAQLKAKADTYGITLVFVNTAYNYEKGEIQTAQTWVENNLKYMNPAYNGLVGVSLGFYGPANYALVDPNFCKKFAVVFPTSSGPFPDNSPIFKNLVDANCRVWCTCSVQDDGDSGTTYRHTEKIYTNMKALRPDAKVMLTKFPAGIFKADPTTDRTAGEVAHMAVFGRLTQSPMGVPADYISGIPDLPLKMDMYQWALSNPKGSVYQPPTEAYKGPVVDRPAPTPAPTAKYIKRFVFTGDYNNRGSVNTEIQFSDGSSQVIKAPAGDKNVGAAVNIATKTVALDFIKQPNQSIPW